MGEEFDEFCEVNGGPPRGVLLRDKDKIVIQPGTWDPVCNVMKDVAQAAMAIISKLKEKGGDDN